MDVNHINVENDNVPTNELDINKLETDILENKPKDEKPEVDESEVNESEVNELDNELEVDEPKKKQKKKKKKKESYFSVKALFAQIEGYGYNYSMKSFLLQLLLVWAVLGVAGYFYKLKILCLIILAIIGALLTPAMIKAQFKFLYEQERFADVTDYLEHVIYSFIKRPKIREALSDAAMLLQGRKIKDVVDKAVNYIDYESSPTLYQDAFDIIEEKYGCEKVRNVHNFLKKVEEEGGEYEQSILVLLEDLQAWSERTYVYQQKRKAVKNAVIMAIAMSLVMCGVLNFYIPEDFTIINNVIYQITSTIFLGLMAVIYTFVQTVLTGSWIDEKGERKDKDIIRDYRYFIYFDLKRELKRNLVWVISFAAIAVVSYFILHQKTIAILLGFCAWWYATMPKRRLKSSKKRLEQDLQKAFPGWLRDIAISLQTQTVQVAIINSEKNTPTVLKRAVHKLIEDFTENPSGFEPWNDFLAEFDVPQLKSAAKMFYSINQLGDDEATEQINRLIERNNKLVQQADDLKAENALTTMGYIVAAPMAVSILKLLTDMILLLISFVNIASNINIGI